MNDDLIFAVNEEVARAAMIDEKDNNGGKYGRINVNDLFDGKARFHLRHHVQGCHHHRRRLLC